MRCIIDYKLILIILVINKDINNQNQEIKPDILISEIVENYPKIAEFLFEEYSFHCINCFMAEYETLQEGAFRHGIRDEEFDQLLGKLNEMIGKD